MNYTAGVISFADSVQPNHDEQHEAIDHFEKLAFAGLEQDQYDCLWVRHVHEGNVELYFCTPRLELTEARTSISHRQATKTRLAACRCALINQQYYWVDPLEPEGA